MEQPGSILDKLESRGFFLMTPSTADLENIWQSIAPFFYENEKLWKPYESLDNIYVGLQQQVLQLWVVGEAETGKHVVIGVTKTELFPTGLKCLTLSYMMGSGLREHFTAYKGLFDYIEAFAIVGGCDIISANVRPGLSRYVKEMGFQVTKHVVEKTLIPNGRAC